MQILAIDVGTGTQDILLYDTEHEPENALKLIMPAPTQLMARQIGQATAAGEDVLLTGVTMGGGPCAWAVEQHLRAGRRVFATPAAACTIDDDLTAVAERGVQVVSEDEAAALHAVREVRLRDVDMEALRQALAAFQVTLRPAAIGVAVFDHGAAPPGYSDRRFRFDYLARRLHEDTHLTALSFLSGALPVQMTRMHAVADDLRAEAPLLLMDTPSAAVLGALEDRQVRNAGECMAVNVGNGHTLAMRLRGERVLGLFEHHTGRLSRERLDTLLDELWTGRIDNDAVYADHGHGALVLESAAGGSGLVSVTGPRRALLSGSRHAPYFAVPYGDMMVAGCWGLVRALATHLPALSGPIAEGLARGQ